MGEAPRARTRVIARAAVEAELAQAAFEHVSREGFEKVTINDLATAAGVSRSTFLRYFASKEDAILFALDAQGDELAEALRRRPRTEGDWTALRRALDSTLAPYHDDPGAALATTRLIQEAPSLYACQMERQHSWRFPLARALADRHALAGPVPPSLEVKATSALVCLNVALTHWIGSNGELDLVKLVDEAFDAFS